MTPEEKAVIEAAMRDHRGCAAETCGGTSYDPCRLGSAIEALIRARENDPAFPPEEQERCPNGGRAWGEPKAKEALVVHGVRAVNQAHAEALTRMHEEQASLVSDWVPATLLYCLAGDRIRIGADESDVTRSSSGAWHANVVSSVLPSGKTWDKVTPWEHTELRLDLSANPGFRQYPPNTPCEIWMNAERRAVHVIMAGFPGSVIIDSSSVSK